VADPITDLFLSIILIMGKMLYNYMNSRDSKSTGCFDSDESDHLVIISRVSLDLSVGFTEIPEGICLSGEVDCWT
jgi:hypothetical protein